MCLVQDGTAPTIYSVVNKHGYWGVLKEGRLFGIFPERKLAYSFVLGAIERRCAEGRASKVLVDHDPHGPELVLCPEDPPPGTRLS